MPAPDFVAHHPSDSVGVVVIETVSPGQLLSGWVMGADGTLEIRASDEVPLGHKLALRDIAAGDTVIKYGQDIGRAVEAIATGAHVHTHNLKTKRW